MSFTRESAVDAAKKDLATRLNIEASAVEEQGVIDEDFPDMSLGAPVDGEMSAQMISSGWKISLSDGTHSYEYRADKYQLRLYNFHGKNFVVS
ncbi:MAG: hypothetical protein JO053_13935 [Acidobacteria bacterium]|nr:hypothetical protein [Acidobacteriota bacterium]